MSDWRYIAQRLDGKGGGTFLDYDMPLDNVEITHNLSGPASITGDLPVHLERLTDEAGRPLFQRRSTAVYAEKDGVIVAGGILDVPTSAGPKMSLSCLGFVANLVDQPYEGSTYFVDTDPLDIAREVVGASLRAPMGDTGLKVDATTTELKVGLALTQTQFDTVKGEVAFESGPYKLAWWLSNDLFKEFNELAEKTPFDYWEDHFWDGEAIRHQLRLYYPRKGRRQENLRFVLGENIAVTPQIRVDAGDYANAVMVLGAGEGRDMIRGWAERPDGRLRTVARVAVKDITTAEAANARAAAELDLRQGYGSVKSIVVRESLQAPLGSWEVGDEIYVQAEDEWTQFVGWMRVISITIKPADESSISMELVRMDTVPRTQLKVVTPAQVAKAKEVADGKVDLADPVPNPTG